MDLIVICRDREYIVDNEYFFDCVSNLEDTKTALNNPRLEFIINNFEHFKIKRKNKYIQNKTNTIKLLHSLSQEVNKNNLSIEDEQFIDEIMGNDPMCMF